MKSEQLIILEQLAKKYRYGRSPEHAKQVKKLSLQILDELYKLRMLPTSPQDRFVLEAAALLHDTGLATETFRKPHNESGFDMLAVEIPEVLSANPLSSAELSTILYCVLWHRGDAFNKRGNIKIEDLAYVKKMAAILRIADALNRTLAQVVEDVSLSLTDNSLKFSISATRSADTEIKRATEKDDLFKEAFDLTDIEFCKSVTRPVKIEAKSVRRDSTSKNVLLVCGGNTCRSPMAKVIFEQKLNALGKFEEFKIDSAAYDSPTYQKATKEGRAAIMILYGSDLLASHQSKKITPDLIQTADLILVMSPRMKIGLPAEKTYTLKEYAGDTGDIDDPFGGDVNTYLKTATDISGAVDKIIPKLSRQR